MTVGPGTRVGHYVIEAPLGAGGMGEVYRAHDPRLGRDVALKLLRAEVANDQTRLERFTREARAVAALNHPHIVTIYSTEEADGVRFMTMELLEGQSLDQLIPAQGLPLARFLELAVPITDALKAAHQKQITHRDLKPANVMVSVDGRVKVLDFGLATAPAKAGALNASVDRPGSSPADQLTIASPQITTPGMIVGTMPYMSPEQVEGKVLDDRSDLFSLGVMFYEMLTGMRPFAGESPPQLMSSILRDAPRDINEIRGDVPDALGRLVARCLEKRPDERVQTARDVYNELRHLQRSADSGPLRRASSGTATAAVNAESLRMVVKPFAAQGGRDAEALASGLTDDITLGLARFPYLAVATRASTNPERSGRAGIAARYVVEGSVRMSADRVRIGAQLIDTEQGVHLWTDTYNRDLAATDVLTLQDDVVDRVVATVGDVHGVLMQSMTRSLRATPTRDAPLDELHLRYWRYHRQHAPDEHAALRDVLEALIAREPNRATAWTALAHLYCHEVAFGFNVRAQSLRRARQAVTRALDLEAANQHAWEALAITCFFEHDRDGFVDAVDRAMALNPRNTSTAAMLGSLLAHMGQHERGLQITARAMDLNPQHPRWYHFTYFVTHYDRGQYADALRAARKVNLPAHLWSHFAIAVSCGQLGRADEARDRPGGVIRAGTSIRRCRRGSRSGRKSTVEVVRRSRRTRPGRISQGARVGGRADRRAVDSLTTVGFGETCRPGRAHDAGERCVGTTALIGGGAALRRPERSERPGMVLRRNGRGDHQHAGASLGPEGDCAHFRVCFQRPERAKSSHCRGSRRDVGLEGSVRRVAQRIRVSAQLVRAHDGAQLWSERYDRDLADVFAVQDDIASCITRELRGQLVPGKDVVRVRTPNVAAYEAYLMGKHHVWNFRSDWYEKGLEQYEGAIALDPDYGLPYLGLAELFHIHASTRGESSRASASRIRPVVEQALRCDDAPAEAHAWRGVLAAAYEYDWAEAARRFDAAMATRPVVPRIRHLYGYFYLRFIGKASEAVEEHRRALRDGDPLSLITRVGLVMSLMSAREHEEQVRESQRLRELAPDFHAHVQSAHVQCRPTAAGRGTFVR